MPMDVNEASRRYRNGVEPYVRAYNEARGVNSSIRAQEIMEGVRDQTSDLNSLVQKFEAGYEGRAATGQMGGRDVR